MFSKSFTRPHYHTFPDIKPSKQWNTEHYRESVDHGEGNLDTDLNSLDSGNIWQYDTASSKCENFSLDLNRLSSVFYIYDLMLITALVLFSLLCARNYHYNNGLVWYVLPLDSQYCYGWLSILFLFILLLDTPAYVYLLLLSIDLQMFC